MKFNLQPGHHNRQAQQCALLANAVITPAALGQSRARR